MRLNSCERSVCWLRSVHLEVRREGRGKLVGRLGGLASLDRLRFSLLLDVSCFGAVLRGFLHARRCNCSVPQPRNGRLLMDGDVKPLGKISWLLPATLPFFRKARGRVVLQRIFFGSTASDGLYIRIDNVRGHVASLQASIVLSVPKFPRRCSEQESGGQLPPESPPPRSPGLSASHTLPNFHLTNSSRSQRRRLALVLV